MPSQTLALLILAAFLHASYHALYKKSIDKGVFAWWFILVATIVYFPALISTPFHFPREGWLCIFASGVAEAAYYIATSEAYERGDLSVVYPLARGAAPLFVTLWAILFLEERPTSVGLAGILLVVSGIYLLNIRSFAHLLDPLPSLKGSSSRFALLASLCISIYSVLDKVGVGYVPPLIYIYLVLVVALAIFTPYILLTGRRAEIIVEWRANKASILVAGVLILFTYFLVLTAMKMAYVSYVASVREVSIVFGALLGYFLLKERYGPIRVFASILIFLGVFLIGRAA